MITHTRYSWPALISPIFISVYIHLHNNSTGNQARITKLGTEGDLAIAPVTMF